jgi:hypothetical protein
MMGKLDEMIKTHEEMGAKHEAMKGRMKMHHERMGSLMKMLKETMGVVKDLEHVPSSAQKQKLSDMIGALEEMIKTHEEMGKMRRM